MGDENLKQLLLQSMDDIKNAFQENENSGALTVLAKLFPLKKKIIKL